MSTNRIEHTPGPWIYEACSDYIHEESTGHTIARVCANSGHVDPRYRDSMPLEANAALIAAAPDLLDACRDAVAARQKMFDVMPVAWETIDHILTSAIRAAEGGKVMACQNCEARMDELNRLYPEIERLMRIEAAARAYIKCDPYSHTKTVIAKRDALRAALETKP